MRHARWFGVSLIMLGVGIAVCALLGPLGFDLVVYRTSHTMLNQLVGADAAGLVVVAPASIAIGILALRGHPAAPVLALAPSIFAVYTYAQIIIGQEYLREPGNIERFFPLLLAVFVLAEAIAVRAGTAVPAGDLPSLSRRTRRFTAGLLGFIAFFLVAGLHLPSYVDAVRDHPTRVEFVSSPTPFFLVKLMDLGMVVPICLVVAIGLLQDRAWARKPTYAIVGGFALLAASVTGMAVTMYANDDPDSSLAMVLVFGVVFLLVSVLSGLLYRPLLRIGQLTSRPADVR
jgi:hypothetical protein